MLDSRKQGMDWLRFFVGRVLRLVPLHWFAVSLMFAIVMILSQGQLFDAMATAKGMILWLALLGSPDLNQVIGTRHILAGVTWSLPYEWFFYLSLPVIALSLRLVAPVPVLMIGLAGVAGAIAWHADPQHALQFLGGIAAALLVRCQCVTRLATSTGGSILVILLLIAEVGLFPTAYGVVQVILQSAVFVLIAGGASLFNLLTCRVSRMLGEMAYSMYLLHGILLFVTFRFILGFEAARLLTPVEHWLVIYATVPVLILVCFGTFRLIERPGMNRANPATSLLRRWSRRKRPKDALIRI